MSRVTLIFSLIIVIAFSISGIRITKDKQSSIYTDYQIVIYNDTIWLYDDNRFVGKCITNWNSNLDSLILIDNQ